MTHLDTINELLTLPRGTAPSDDLIAAAMRAATAADEYLQFEAAQVFAPVIHNWTSCVPDWLIALAAGDRGEDEQVEQVIRGLTEMAVTADEWERAVGEQAADPAADDDEDDAGDATFNDGRDDDELAYARLAHSITDGQPVASKSEAERIIHRAGRTRDDLALDISILNTIRRR